MVGGSLQVVFRKSFTSPAFSLVVSVTPCCVLPPNIFANADMMAEFRDREDNGRTVELSISKEPQLADSTDSDNAGDE